MRRSGSWLPLGVGSCWDRNPSCHTWITMLHFNFIFQIDQKGSLVSLVVMRKKRVDILECPWRCAHHRRDSGYSKHKRLSWLECSPPGKHPPQLGHRPRDMLTFFTELLTGVLYTSRNCCLLGMSSSSQIHRSSSLEDSGCFHYSEVLGF